MSGRLEMRREIAGLSMVDAEHSGNKASTIVSATGSAARLIPTEENLVDARSAFRVVLSSNEKLYSGVAKRENFAAIRVFCT